MKSLIVLFFVVQFGVISNALGQEYEKEILAYQNELNEEYKDPEESPLIEKERKKFKGHDFFPVNENYRVKAKFSRTENSIPFQMKTTTGLLPTYEKYGEATFELDGRTFNLNIYQSHQLREMEEYKNYLFLPFVDLTSGDLSYGGGRYIDLEIPSGDTIVIDFNKAYNPYCAYNPKYSCPIPPRENNLDIEILAGVMYRY